MSLQVQVFPSFPKARWEAFKAKILADTGTELAEVDSKTDVAAGTVTHGSFEFTYKYVPEETTLYVQCLKKPLFISTNTIINGIAEEIAELKF